MDYELNDKTEEKVRAYLMVAQADIDKAMSRDLTLGYRQVYLDAAESKLYKAEQLLGGDE